MEGMNADDEILYQIDATKSRQSWLEKVKMPDLVKSYANMFKSANNENAEALHKKMMKKLPDYFLRRRLVKMSNSAEIFLTLRSEFAKSLAVSSIFGYVLGIGDRHLDNLLMDTKRGSVVQIDFGVCFGMGASVLPVPELMPFRLTRQLLGVFHPLDGCNIVRYFMTKVMTSIRTEVGKEALSEKMNYLLNYLYEFVSH